MRVFRVSRCARQRSTAPPSPVTRTAVKMASHSRDTASSPEQPGKAFFAQEGIGTLPTHQGKPLDICRR